MAQLSNLRFPRASPQNRPPHRCHSGKQGIFHRADTRKRKNNLCPAKSRCLCMQEAVRLRFLYFRAQRTECPQMPVDWTFSDHTSAGAVDPRLAKASQKRSQKHNGRAHFPHRFLLDPPAIHLRSIDFQPVSVQRTPASQRIKNPHHTEHILYSGDIFKHGNSAV